MLIVSSTGHSVPSLGLSTSTPCGPRQRELWIIKMETGPLALAGVAQLVEHWPANQRVAGSLLIRAHGWFAGRERAGGDQSILFSHINVSLSPFLPLL